MTDLERRTQTVIVKLPAEIDLANAADVYAQLFSAIAADTKVVVADLTSTSFAITPGERSRDREVARNDRPVPALRPAHPARATGVRPGVAGRTVASRALYGDKGGRQP
jgi:hypothetical protein